MKIFPSALPVTEPTSSARSRCLPVAVLVGLALVAGCSSTSDYEAAPRKKEQATEIPRWIRDGVRIARATKAARSGGTGVSQDLPSLVPIGGGRASDSDTLPSKDVVVGALTGAGLTAQQAGCIYDGVSANPQTAKDVTALLKGLAGASTATAAAGTPAAFDPATLPGLANLSQESTTRLVLAIAPCLDQAALLGLLAAGQGLGTGAGGTEGIAALLSSAQGLDLTKLAGFDPNAIASAVAGALGSDQVRQIQALLATVGTTGAELLNNPLLTLDITKLDLSTLTQEQMPLLVLALLKGLTSDQQGQLMKLAQVNLDELNIKIDPDKLKPEEIGTLLLILAPLLAGAIKTTPVTVPPGGDPNQVYIPPGADLSNLNPLTFLNRDDVIAQFQKQGIDPVLGGCIFDGLSDLAPSTIAAFFSPDAAPAAAGSVLLIAVSCLAQGR